MEELGFTRDPLFPESLAHQGPPALADLFDVQEVETPFVGLRPFEVADGPLFFGRREQTQELLQRLHRTRFVAVVGGSGCGKSSLVRAGLIPALQAGFLVADRDSWEIFTIKPGDQPLRNLTSALPRADGEPVAVEETAAGIRLFGVNAVLDRLQPLLDPQPPAHRGSNVLLVVDQFEETFRFGLRGDEDRRDEAAEFTSILLALAQKPGLPIYVVLTMRSDFMGDCDAFPGLAEAMNRSIFLVPRLTRQQRREAIEGPIRMAGAAISPRLLDRLLNESDAASDQLPVLQHALMRIWEEWREDEMALAAQPPKGNGSPLPAGILGRPLRQPPIGVEHYERAATLGNDRTGTLGSVLNRHAEKALAGLDPILTRKVFQALTDVDAANRQIRRPARLSVLERVTGGARKDIGTILERFRSDGRCFVVWTGSLEKDDPLIDLSHESLIRCWKTLAQWVEEEADSAAVYRRLEAATARYLRNAGGLWRGAELQQALDWEAKHEVEVEWAARVRPSEMFQKPSWKRPTLDQVLAFLKESQIAREQEREREAAQKQELLLVRERARQAQELAENRRRWFLGLAAISVVAVAFAVAAGYFERRLSKTVLSSQLIRQSKEVAATDPQRSILLAVEALSLEPEDAKRSKEAENALRSALTWIGGRGLGGHSPDINFLEVSPDGRWLMSGARDGTALRWDLSAERPETRPLSLTGEDRSRSAGGSENDHLVAVAAARGRVAVGGLDGSVRLEGWDHPLKPAAPKRPEISALAMDADGRWLAAGDKAGDLWVWELVGKKEREIRLPKLHIGPVFTAEISQDGRWLVTASSGNRERPGQMVVWALAPGQSPRKVDSQDLISAVDLSRDNRLALGGGDGRIWFWQLAPEAPRGHREIWDGDDLPFAERASRMAGAPIRSIAVDPAGNRIVAAAGDGKISLWAGAKPFALTEQNERDLIADLKISSAGQLVAVYNNGSVRLWGTGNWQAGRALSLRGHRGGVKAATFSADGRWLFTGGSDGTVRRWNLTVPDPTSEAIQHPGAPNLQVVDASPDFHWLVSTIQAGKQTSAELCKLSSRRCERLRADELPSLKISSDSRWLVTGNGGKPSERWFRLRDLKAEGALIWASEGGNVSALEVSPSAADPWLITGQPNGSIRIDPLSASGGREKGPIPLLPAPPEGGLVDRVVMTPDRRFVGAAWEKGLFRLWKTGRARPVVEDRLRISSWAVSPDSRWLAIADDIDVVRVWDLSGPVPVTGEPHQTQRRIQKVTFGPDGRLVLGFEDGSVLSYFAAGTEKLRKDREFPGHQAAITSLTVSPAGRYLATGGDDGSARVWDLRNEGFEPAVMMSPTGGGIIGSLFGQDDRTLRTMSRDGTIRRWSLTEDRLRQEARIAVGRNLSAKEWCRSFSGSSLVPDQPYRAIFEDLPLLGSKGAICRPQDGPVQDRSARRPVVRAGM